MALDPTTDYITREERYLAVMAGAGIQYPEPITREEHYLAAMCDPSQDFPEPITRREQFLSAIASKNGKLIATDEIEVNTSSTTAAKVKTITLPADISSAGKYLYIKIRDKAGIKNGYCLGSDNYGSGTPSRIVYKGGSSVPSVASTSGYGVYVNSITTSNSKFTSLDVYSRYNSSSSGTINGTYKVEIYLCDIA